MKNLSMLCVMSLILGMLVLPALGQEGPPPGMPGMGGGGDAGGPPRRERGPGGPGGPGMRPPPDVQKVEMLRGYLDVVDHFTKLAHDPTAAGVAAVLAANDLLRPRGTDVAIDYFNKTLPNVKDEAVQRAIRIQLIDLYKQAGQQDKAIEQLDILMTGSKGGSAALPSP